MAKIRTIKDAFWTDDLLVQCSFVARLFFIGLWQFSDDDGVFEWRPLTLKMKVFPSPTDQIDIEDLLDELLTQQLIARFDVDGKMYGIVRNFAKHQKVDARFHKSTIGDLTNVEFYYTSSRVNPREHAGSRAGGGSGGGGGSGPNTSSYEDVSASDKDGEPAAAAVPKVVDPVEAEFRQFLPIASEILREKKVFSTKGLKRWQNRRDKFSARELGEAFVNLQNEPDRWKIRNNGWRSITWWLASDERIEEMQNCHKKGIASDIRSV